MTKNFEILANLLNFLQIKESIFYGSERNLMDLMNLFPFTHIINANDIMEINQVFFNEEEDIKIIFSEEPDLIKKSVNIKKKILLCTKYVPKGYKITREILINIYEKHFNLNIPCDIRTQIEELNTSESVYSTLLKIKLNGGVYNPRHTPIIFHKDHPISFFLNKINTIPNNSKKNNLLILLSKILHEDFLITGNITLTSYYKLIEQMINK